MRSSFAGRIRETILKAGSLLRTRILGDEAPFHGILALIGGLFVNLAFTSVHVVASFLFASFWFAALGAYHLILGAMRFHLLLSARRLTALPQPQRLVAEMKAYRLCGYLMFGLNAVMGGVIVLMVLQNRSFTYSGYVIYAAAFFSFYCMVLAVFNLIRFRRSGSPLLSAAKTVSFCAALMSILALQTAMLQQFKGNGAFRQMMNTVTGSSVGLIVFGIALFMVYRSNRALKNVQGGILYGQ